MNPTPAPYRFFAFDASYFSAKVRPALRYKGVWYRELPARPGEIRRRTGLGFIPILVTPEDETWQDSSEILDALERRHPEPPLLPATPVQRIAAHLVELYADEFGTLPAMHTRWGVELSEATTRARFAAMLGDAELGRKAADRMAGARVAIGATEETGPAIEAHLGDLLAALSSLFEAQPFLLGARMSFADCALMGPCYGHFFNDLGSRRLLLESAVPVVGWIERCSAPDPEEQGEWLADDALAPGLLDVLCVMGRDAAPLVLETVRAVERWADDNPDRLEAPPRIVGGCEASLRGTPLERIAQVYTLWMLQRTLDAYQGLEEGERARVDSALSGTGWEALLAHRPRHRVEKWGFELIFRASEERSTT